MKCLYCPVELIDETKDAHAIPSGMGGRLKSKRTACDNCNSEMGRTIEGRVTEAFQPFMASLGAISGKGQRPTPPVTVDVPGRAPMKLHGGVLHSEQSRSPEVAEPDGRVSVTFHGSDMERLADQAVNRLLEKKLTPHDLEVGEKASLVLINSEYGQEVKLGTYEYLIQSDDHDRVATKIAL